MEVCLLSRFYKKSFIIFLIIVIAFSSGCTNVVKKGNVKGNKAVKQTAVPYSEELASIFPYEVDTTLYYQGFVEYGHIITVRDVKVTDDKQEKIITAEGYMGDGLGPISEKGTIRKFDIRYLILNDRVVEEIKELNEETRVHKTIIPNKIILKLPLQTGNSWDQKFKDNEGREYTAKTTIEKVEALENGVKKYTVKTTVDKIPGYKGSKYVETRVFETGKGMTEFINRLSGYVDEKGKTQFYDFDFHYELFKITKEHYELPEEKK